MTQLAYLKNYLEDLSRSKTTPLLIELNQDEIKLIHNDSQKKNAHHFPLLLAQRVYNNNLDNKGNNLIVIDGDNEASSDSFNLLETLLEALRDELKSIKSITTLKETLKTAASMATGGLLNDFAGDYLDKGFDFIFDEVSDQFSDLLTEAVIDNADVSKLLLSSIEGLLGDTTGDQLGDLADNINKQSLNLSSAAKSELDKLSSTFSSSQNNDAFQLTFKLLLAIALDSPKLIYINNPYKLDDNSIGMLSLLFSFAKNQKEHDRHIGLSVLYAYTDEQFHLYNNVDTSLQSKQQLLMAQRRFVQRYAMLEKPGSDIPTVAVKSSLFIGRNQELEGLNRDFLYRQPTTLSVISGEPGIGKTALVNQHLTNIQKQQDIIKLTLFNEVGHSSTNTGLSSLEKSILDQAKELQSRVSFKDKSRNFIKNSGTKENAFKAIGLLFAGADKALGIADAAFQRAMVDNHVDGFKQMSMGDLDSKQGDEKQRQFYNLDMAIKKLQNISAESLPLVLFIDDMQWIDDTASEYILTRLLQQPDLYIVATLRPSDAATVLAQQLKSQSLHEHSLALLKACHVKGSDTCDDNINDYPLQACTTTLPGFDKSALVTLLAKVIQGETRQYEALANAIFNALAGDGAQDVNTLFAVETINMLCDKKLYSENRFERLILDSPLHFNPKVQDIESTLTKTFNALQSKYKDSLAHANEGIYGHQFNLMAYAVLEERLHLLKLYFGKQGNVAVNTLLFSSLLGAPFSSGLVKRVMNVLTETEEDELLPLKFHLLGSESATHLLPEHYAIIDEVYEILRRLSVSDDKYQYRHGLLHIFLDKQFDYLLDNVFSENTLLAKEKCIALIANEINFVIKGMDLNGKVLASLTALQVADKLFHENVKLNVYAKGFAFNADVWAEDYTVSLSNLATSYQQNNQMTKAIELKEKALVISETYYQLWPDLWAEKYTVSLSNLANSYKQNNQVAKAIELEEKALAIRERYYQQSPDVWAEDYTVSLSNLATSYQQNNQVTKAIELQEKALAIRERYYQQSPDVWTEHYTVSLSNLASSYQQNNQVSKAIDLGEKALAIRERYYQQSPDVWAEDYTTSLNNLANSYQQNNQVVKAIDLLEKALAITEHYYQQSSDVWAEKYTVSLSNLASSYQQNNQMTKAIDLQEQALAITESNYQLSPDVWAEKYTVSLSNLASSYQQNNQVAKAIELEEKALAIRERYYQQSPDVWAEHYTVSLSNLATSYQQNNQVTKAIELQEKALAIRERYYQQSPDVWTEHYTVSLSNLASSYQQNNQVAKAIDLGGEALAIRERYYQQSPDVWAEDYTTSLNNLANSYQQNNQVAKAIDLLEKALVIRERYYQQSSDVWAEKYTVSLNNLASSYQQSNQMTKAIELEEQALAIRESYFQNSPDVWAEDYTNSLNSLAYSYQQNNQVMKAIELREKALVIRESYYRNSPDVWAEKYTTSLNNLAHSYQQNNQVAKSIDLLEKALTITESYYQQTPNVWEEDYITSLTNLAVSYQQNNQVVKAIELREKALVIRESYFQNSPDVWAEDYTTSLTNLAISYYKNNQVTKAIELEEKALDIREAYYEQSPDVWAEDYITSLNNLACFYEELGKDADALALRKKQLLIYQSLYQQSPTTWLQEYMNSLNDFASVSLRLRQLQTSYESFSLYFELFSAESISDVEQCVKFVYAFVKYAQSAIHLSKDQGIYFDKMANEFNMKMSAKFSGGYKHFIALLLNGDENTPAYAELGESNDPFDNEKYQLFVKYFCAD
ncbi:tetratricopeptide repeat protein [uncultured Shewanella sp.]|uniref:tetratricopeptide repeat protein n=1 Tax=uncultured Shewanella sp. TaxID=173975 RepID=UPI00262F7F00|nr:tetratricopeptide repeat protein [uncultured Shewanella sp.]